MIAPSLFPIATTFAATATKSKGNPLGSILIFVVPVAALLLFMNRNNKKKSRAAHALQTELTLGATVITIGGLYGTVRSITDDDVELEVAPGVVSRYARRAVATVLPPDEPLDAAGVDSDAEPDSAPKDNASGDGDEPPAQGTDEY